MFTHVCKIGHVGGTSVLIGSKLCRVVPNQTEPMHRQLAEHFTCGTDATQIDKQTSWCAEFAYT
jgi:hypothetical protein